MAWSTNFDDACFSPTDNRYVTTDTVDLASGLVQLWNGNSGRLIKSFLGHKSKVNDVCFGPNAELIASASDDGTVRIWDVQSGKEVRNLQINKAPIVSVAFSNDSEIIAAAEQGVIRFWDNRTGKIPAT